MATLNVIYRIAADVSSLEQNVAKATQLTDRMDQKLTGIQKTALSVGSALGTAFAGAAIADGLRRLVTESVNYADALTNLSAKTQISVQGLQRLESIGVSAGLSMDQLARSVIELHKNIDKQSGIDAIRNMGLQYEHIRDLKPEAQFIEIAKALALIDDPVKRANVGTALFGRTFADVAGAFEQDVDKIVANAALLSDSQVKALDDAGDAWDQFATNAGRHLKGWLGSLFAAQMEVDRIVPLLFRPTALRESFLDLPKPPSVPNLAGAGPTEPLDLRFSPEFDRIIRESDQFFQKQDQLRRQAEQKEKEDLEHHIKMTNQIREQAWIARAKMLDFNGLREIERLEDLYQKSQVALESNIKAEADIRADAWSARARMLDMNGLRELEEIDRLYEGTQAQSEDNVRRLQRDYDRIKNSGVYTAEAIAAAWKKLHDAQQSLKGGLFGLTIENVTKLNTHLGQVEDVLGGIQTKWAQMSVVAVRAVESITTKLATGDWVGAIVAGVSGVIGLFGELFGITEESQRVSPMRDEFFDMAGGLETLNPQVVALTGNLKLVEAVFTAKTVEDYNAAIGDLTDLLERNKKVLLEANATFGDTRKRLSAITVMTPELRTALDRAFEAESADDFLASMKAINTELDKQKQRFNDIRDTLAKYGIPESEATDALFQTQVINERAQQLRKDFDNLKLAGVDMNVAMRAMGSSVNDFVKTAIAMGVEVPESMREVIQVAIDAGEIYDASGKKIEHMDELGLTFGVTMETVMADIETAIERLIVVLEGMAKFFGVVLPNAAQDAADGIQDALDSIEPPSIEIPVDYDLPSFKDFPFPVYTADAAAMGGLVTEQGIQRFAAGGRVLNFIPRGLDTVPAMLAPGEGVVNHRGMGMLGEDGLRALNSGDGLGGGGTTVVIEQGAIQAGVLVHESDLEDLIAAAALKGIEKGGRRFGRFSKLVRQAS